MDIHIQNPQAAIELKASSTPPKCFKKCLYGCTGKMPYAHWNVKAGEAHIGHVTQRGCCQDNVCMKCCTKMPSWGINFPADMDVTSKVRMLGLWLMVQTVYTLPEYQK